jgi:hypothetical protein
MIARFRFVPVFIMPMHPIKQSGFVVYYKTTVSIDLSHKCVLSVLPLFSIPKVHASMMLELAILPNILRQGRVSSKHTTGRRKEHTSNTSRLSFRVGTRRNAEEYTTYD